MTFGIKKLIEPVHTPIRKTLLGGALKLVSMQIRHTRNVCKLCLYNCNT